tara:strand:+ start:4108 stop:4260 length:153 start_codon:yes stop_codon:yes gene_type:complete
MDHKTIYLLKDREGDVSCAFDDLEEAKQTQYEDEEEFKIEQVRLYTKCTN